LGFQSFDPVSMEAWQRALEAYSLKRQQRPQPVSQPPRLWGPERTCRTGATSAGDHWQAEHKNGKDDWAKGECCEGDCAKLPQAELPAARPALPRPRVEVVGGHVCCVFVFFVFVELLIQARCESLTTGSGKVTKELPTAG